MSAPKPVLKVSNLSYAYTEANVIENISFEVKPKGFVAIVGPNGSGKTTLIKAILGKLRPKTGSITLFGKKNFSEWERVGYVPQRFSVDKSYPGTVAELLGADCNVPETLGLNHLLSKKFSELSGGQQQRVLIAFALQNDPKLLILDEPTVGIDAKSEKDFYELLKKLNAKGTAIIVVTHDVGMIPIHFKRVICINKTMCCEGPVSKTQELLQEVYGGHVVHAHK